MGKRVLVVEPSRTIRKLLEISLQQYGHQVVLFASSQEARDALALPAFRTYPPEVFLLALDACQPESAHFIEELRLQSHLTSSSIVVMLMPDESTQPRLRHLLQEDGRIIALFKPFRIQDALALVSTSHETFPGAVEAR